MSLLAGNAALANSNNETESAKGAALEWIAGELPPFVWVGADGPQGLAYELAALMSAKLGRSSETKFFPWARAVRMAQLGPAYGVFPLARTPDRETQFRWMIPLTTVSYTFFTRASDSADPDDIEHLRKRRIGVLRGSPIIKNLQAERFSKISEAQSYRDLLRMLSEGLIEAIYAGEPMLRAAIEEFNFKPQDFKRGLTLKSAELYMATSLQLDEVEAERWLQAYRELEREGTVARLQKKYLLPQRER